jgi:hypothetical protein
MRYALCLLVPATLLAWSAVRPPAPPAPPQPEPRPAEADAPDTTFDPDPQHPWNRLHRLLYSRATQEGKVYDQESLEPLFIPESRFLVEGPTHEQALKLLDEFLRERADQRIKDPLKRAVLQRDLWAVFATTAGDAREVIQLETSGRTLVTDRFEDRGDADVPPERRARLRALQKRLVQVMRRVALTPEEIDALPDNLALAARSGAFPRAFDPDQPKRTFLPPDLLAGDGPWLPVSNFTRANEEFLAAPQHARFVKGRSVFVVFLRLPEGRRATGAYLKKTQGGELPQFPEGTQTALLRRLLLIDNTGKLRESPLTESLQFRVYHELDTGIPFELTLRRKDLFAGRNGGLHAVGPDETSYFDFQTRRGDVFEMPKRPPATAVLSTCRNCHERTDRPGGIRSMNTAFHGGGSAPEPTGLWPTDPKREAQMTIDWTRTSYTWGLLQGMWDADDLR